MRSITMVNMMKIYEHADINIYLKAPLYRDACLHTFWKVEIQPFLPIEDIRWNIVFYKKYYEN